MIESFASKETEKILLGEVSMMGNEFKCLSVNRLVGSFLYLSEDERRCYASEVNFRIGC